MLTSLLQPEEEMPSILPSDAEARIKTVRLTHLPTKMHMKRLTIISTIPLHLLPDLHVSPIYQVFCLGSSGRTYLRIGFALRCLQRFSFLDVATQLWGRPPNWLTSGQAISVLSYWR